MQEVHDMPKGTEQGVTRGTRLDFTLLVMSRAGKPLTMREIVGAQGLKFSPYMTDILNQLERDEHIVKQLDDSVYPKRWLYTLTESGLAIAAKVAALYPEV